MSREVDERVVAMYFDNKDFQKKAQATIKTLGELKSNLDIEKSVKGFDTLKKASENLKLDEVNTKVKRLRDNFQGLGNIASKAFDIGTGPLRSIENLFSTFQSYVTKFIGFDLAGKLVGGLESALRQLTVAPISAGWSEYELKMDSIKTIMSGSGESLDVVKEKLEELNHYADQTVYSFSDMTSNIGKFTNNKVKLDDATAAMKGIANATADAGQGAQQASMAMYNISQAFGVGSMKMIDWKSLENANIATVRLKDAFIQAGVASGKLVKKIEKDAKSGENVTKYYVKGFEKGKKAVEVTAENFRETLNKEWLDKDTMLNTFKIYSGELKSITDVRRLGFTEALGFSDEDIQKLLDIGSGAMNAATEVRTFTKMYDALKEAAQSGWAETMELIFGDMEEATGLWTTLNDKISEVLENAAEARNAIFGEWRGMYRDNDGNLRQSEDLYITEYEPLSEKERTAAEDRRRKLKEDIARLEAELRKKDASANKKGKQSEDDLMEAAGLDPATRAAYQAQLEDLKNELMGVEKELLGRPVQKQIMQKQEDGRKVLIDSFFEMIDILKDVGGAFTTAWGNVFGKFDSKKLWAITNGFRDFTKNLRNWLGTSDKAGSRLNKITTGLQGVFSIIKLVSNAATSGFNLLSKIGRPIAERAIDLFEKFGKVFQGLNGLNLGDTIRQIGSNIGVLWNELTGFGWDGIVAGFSEAWGNVKQAVKDWLNENGFGDLATKFTEWKTTIGQKWSEFTGWLEESGIASFFVDTWGWITSQFAPKKRYDDRGFELNNTRSPAAEFLNNAWNVIKGAWNNVIGWSGWTSISQFISNTWTWIVDLFKPKKRYDDRGFELNDTRSPASEFLNNAWNAIKGAWNNVIGWSGWTSISQFISNTWTWIVDLFKPKKRYDDRGFELNDARSPAAEFLNNAWNVIKKAWKNVVGWEGWTSVSQFLSNTWTWIVDLFEPKKRYDDRGFELNDTRSPAAEFLENAWNVIKKAWANVVGWEGWKAIGKFFTDTWGWIQGLIHGSAESTAGTEGATGAVANVISSVNEAADEAKADPEAVNILTTVLDALGEFWEKVSGLATQVAQVTGADRILNTATKLIETIGKIAETIVDVLHGAIVEGDLGDKAWVLGSVLTAVATNIFSSKVRVALAKNAGESEGIGEMVMKMSLGLLVVAAAVSLLGAQSQENLNKGLGALVTMGVVIGVVAAVINRTKKERIDDAPVTAWERLGQNLIKTIGTMGTIAIVLKELPAIISSLSGSGITGTEIAEMFTAVTGLITGVGLIMTVMTKVGAGTSIKTTATAAAGLLAGIAILMTGLLALFGGTGWLANALGSKDEVVKNIKAAGDIFGEISAAMGQIIGGFSRGQHREQSKTAKEDMEWLSEMTKEFTPERMIGLTRMMDAIKTLTTAIPSAPNMDRITKFNEEMPKIGAALARFAVGFRSAFKDPEIVATIGNVDPVVGLEEATKQIEYVERLAKSMAEFQSFFVLSFDRTSMAFDDTVTKRINPEDFTALGNLYAQAAMNLVTAVKNGLDQGEIEGLSTVFDATPIVDSIVIALGYGETAIAEAVHAMVQAGLDNSGNANGQEGYDWSTLFGNGTGTGTYTEGLLGMLSGEGGLMSVLNSALEGINGDQLSTTLHEKLGGVATEFQSMFSLDTFQDQVEGFFPKNAKGELDVESILGNWQENMETISQQMAENDVGLVIKPIFDITDLTAGVEEINEYFRENPITASLETGLPDVNFNMDSDAIVGAIDNVNANIQNLTRRLGEENVNNIGAIRGLSGDIYEIARAIRDLRIYLDTGVLAGAVDDELGLRMLLAGRTG